jgi:hypothetical protein
MGLADKRLWGLPLSAEALLGCYPLSWIISPGTSMLSLILLCSYFEVPLSLSVFCSLFSLPSVDLVINFYNGWGWGESMAWDVAQYPLISVFLQEAPRATDAESIRSLLFKMRRDLWASWIGGSWVFCHFSLLFLAYD